MKAPTERVIEPWEWPDTTWLTPNVLAMVRIWAYYDSEDDAAKSRPLRRARSYEDRKEAQPDDRLWRGYVERVRARDSDWIS